MQLLTEIQKKLMPGENCMHFDEQGILEKNMFQSKDDLIQSKVIIENPQYQSGLYRTFIQYVKQNSKNL